MTFFQILQTTHLPCAYSHFKTQQSPPYLVYLGAGENSFEADDTKYFREPQYQVEYYFTAKDPETEELIEETLLSNGYMYTKSDDVYIDDEGVFVIYYSVT